MALPTIKNATFTIKVKEFAKPIKIRPMIVAEHKSIQQAMDIASEEEVAITIANVVKSCTDGLVTADSVPQYVLDYVFLQIYIASVESKVTSKYTCRNKLKNEDGSYLIDEETGDYITCDGSISVQIPLSNAVIQYSENYESSKVINITDGVKLHLKGLTLTNNIDVKEKRDKVIEIIDKIYVASEKEYTDEEEAAKLANDAAIKVLEDEILKIKKETRDYYLYSSVDYVEDENGISKPEVDFNFEEFNSWIESCPSLPLSNIDAFYSDSPEVGMELKITCPKCMNTENVKLKGLKDFFS